MTVVASGALDTAAVVDDADVTVLVDVSGTKDSLVVVADRRLVQLTVKGTGALLAVLAWKARVNNRVTFLIELESKKKCFKQANHR